MLAETSTILLDISSTLPATGNVDKTSNKSSIAAAADSDVSGGSSAESAPTTSRIITPSASNIDDGSAGSSSSSQLTLNFVESKKGGKILLRAGYRYRINRRNKNGSTIWICTSGYCKSSITLDQSTNSILRESPHSCLPNHAREQVSIVIENCRKRVRTDSAPVSAIYEQEIKKLKTEDFVEDVPKFQSVKKQFYTCRNKYLKVKKASYFKNMSDIELSESVRNDFLLIDDGKEDRILCFVSLKAREILKVVQFYLLDGTFSSSPEPCKQLYTLHADLSNGTKKNQVVPVIFAFLPNKTQDTYMRLFTLLKNKIIEFEPTNFKIDFEVAAINALRTVFPTAHISGCLFHYSKALWKKAEQLKINSAGGMKYVRMCTALAYLPTNYIPEAWLYLMHNSPQDDAVSAFQGYMSSQWMEVQRLFIVFNLVSFALPGAQRESDSDYLVDSCSIFDYAPAAHCTQTDYRLTCVNGITSLWASDIQTKIWHLQIVQWQGECLDVTNLQNHFPELRTLELVNCTSLHTISGRFNSTSKVEKISMHGLTYLYEIPADVVMSMTRLREMDLRQNGLRHMQAALLSGPPLLDRIYLSDNKWDCSDGGLNWLAMEPDNSTVKAKIVDYYKLVCHQQLYKGKPLHVVMNIIRTVGQTCPEGCSCKMVHVVQDRSGAVIPIITVDCAYRGLVTPPASLPPHTTTLRLEGNKITSLRSTIQNVHYKKLADLFLDNNSLPSVKELEASEWFSTFRVLSLRGNQLKQIPVYAFDKAFQANHNIMHVFLGHNPWRCDCHFIPRFQTLLLKYRKVIRDLQDIKCSQSDDKTISLVQISTMPLGNVCKSGVEMPISPINIINLSLTALILLIIGRFLYDWHNFKTTGKLPWLSSILP